MRNWEVSQMIDILCPIEKWHIQSDTKNRNQRMIVNINNPLVCSIMYKSRDTANQNYQKTIQRDRHYVQLRS